MTVRFVGFALEPDARRLTRGTTELHLSPKAFDLLCLLVERRPAVVDKATVRQRLWPGVHVVDASLGNLVAEIRGVLSESSPATSVIRTVHGIGYAFAVEVEASTPPVVVPDPVPTTRCWLVWKDRPIVLAQGENVIGRDAACAAWIDVDGVSRRHASIRVPADAQVSATIVDLSSTNGTYVQNRLIGAAEPLKNGDRIRLGRAMLVFREWDEAAAKTRRVRR